MSSPQDEGEKRKPHKSRKVGQVAQLAQCSSSTAERALARTKPGKRKTLDVGIRRGVSVPLSKLLDGYPNFPRKKLEALLQQLADLDPVYKHDPWVRLSEKGSEE